MSSSYLRRDPSSSWHSISEIAATTPQQRKTFRLWSRSASNPRALLRIGEDWNSVQPRALLPARRASQDALDDERIGDDIGAHRRVRLSFSIGRAIAAAIC